MQVLASLIPRRMVAFRQQRTLAGTGAEWLSRQWPNSDISPRLLAVPNLFGPLCHLRSMLSAIICNH